MDELEPSEQRNWRTRDHLYGLFILILVILKLLDEIHISWAVVLMPLWWPLLLVICSIPLLWIYFEITNPFFNYKYKEDTVLHLMMGFIYWALCLLGVFYVLNEIFQWIDLPKLPDFLLKL